MKIKNSRKSPPGITLRCDFQWLGKYKTFPLKVWEGLSFLDETLSYTIRKYNLLFLIIAAATFISCPAIAAPKEWPGVDETVVEKYAREHGRGARTPLINTDQGDLLLFVFLLAGALGGFLAGYCWRMLVVEKPSR